MTSSEKRRSRPAELLPHPDPALARRGSGWPRRLGPGLISGAADDDPSGIVTYTQAGAQLGYGACWILLLCYPLIVVTQDISARIGRATGGGIIANLRGRYPGWLVHGLVALLVLTNTINLGADLGAMADVLQLLLGGHRLVYVVGCGSVCAGLLLRLRLRLYVRFVKWAALSLLVYVVAAVSVMPSWPLLLQPALTPALPVDRPSITLLSAVMGTTISPYLLIWQSSLEAERAHGLPHLRDRRAAAFARSEISRIRLDTCAGMLVAIVVAGAMVVTAASTLHAHGITHIETTADAARALRPIAGPLTHALFSLGILATGVLAVPMLAGSAAYAVGESQDWRAGLAWAPFEAPGFYGCILACTLGGMAMTLFGFSTVQVLLWSAVINGILSVPILAYIMLMATQPHVMGLLSLSGPLRALGWLCVAVMTAVVAGLLISAVWAGDA